MKQGDGTDVVETYVIGTWFFGAARNIASVTSARLIHVVVVLDADVDTLLCYSNGVRGLTSVGSFVVARDR